MWRLWLGGKGGLSNQDLIKSKTEIVNCHAFYIKIFKNLETGMFPSLIFFKSWLSIYYDFVFSDLLFPYH